VTKEINTRLCHGDNRPIHKKKKQIYKDSYSNSHIFTTNIITYITITNDK